MKEDKILQKMVNSSGFLFQLAVQSEILQTATNHKWKVLSHEHPWIDLESRREGFIDLVLSSNNTERLIIECKRSLDASWIFLMPEGSKKDIRIVRGLWIDFEVDKRILTGWHDFKIIPESYESEFCIIRGQGEGDKSMLERLSRNLLNSMECFMTEELSIVKNQKFHDLRIYYPVIVTSAQLYLCHFDASKVSIEDGKLNEAHYESVPFIRFRKSLALSLLSDSAPRNIQEANKERERTILIVNASELTNILSKWKIQERTAFEKWPWQIDRENESRLPQG